MKKAINSLLFLFSCSTGYASIKPDGVAFQYCANYAPVRGFLQIPCGGGPGTTSHSRPAFHEVGIDDTVFHDFDLTVYYRCLGIYLGAEINHLRGKRRLKKDLISHDVFIPAGEELNVHAVFDWYQIGAMYSYCFFKRRMWIAPLIEYSVLCFDYRFNASAGKSSRTFDAPTVRFGFKSRYCLNQKATLRVDGAASIPDLLRLDVYTVSAKLVYSIHRTKHADADILFGLGIAALDFQDKQTVPNHMKLQMYPAITAGIQLIWH